jgi:hypothetical protein
LALTRVAARIRAIFFVQGPRGFGSVYLKIDSSSWLFATAWVVVLGAPERTLHDARAHQLVGSTSHATRGAPRSLVEVASQPSLAPSRGARPLGRAHIGELLERAENPAIFSQRPAVPERSAPAARVATPPAVARVPLSTALGSLAAVGSGAAPRLFAAVPAAGAPPTTPLPLLGLASIAKLGKGSSRAGLGVNGSYDDPRMDCISSCGAAPPASSPSTVRTMLAGAAAAGVGTGVVLALTAPPRPAKTPLTPGLKLGVAPQKLSAAVIWSF